MILPNQTMWGQNLMGGWRWKSNGIQRPLLAHVTLDLLSCKFVIKPSNFSDFDSNRFKSFPQGLTDYPTRQLPCLPATFSLPYFSNSACFCLVFRINLKLPTPLTPFEKHRGAACMAVPCKTNGFHHMAYHTQLGACQRFRRPI